MDPVLSDRRITAYGLFLEASRALTHALARASDKWGGIPPSFDILLRLARSDDQRLRMTDLAAQCGMSPSGLSRAVDRLENDGLVVRAACPGDARVAYAELTRKGDKLIVSALKRHLVDLDAMFIDVLSTEELQQLDTICRKLRDRHHPGAAQGTRLACAETFGSQPEVAPRG